MNQYTPAQEKVIETWTEKRDSLFREVGVLQTELDSKNVELKQAGVNLDQLNKDIEFAKGRLTEIQSLEERQKNSLSIEIANLIAEKSKLETECIAQKETTAAAQKEEERLLKSICVLCESHDKIADRAKDIDIKLGHILNQSEKYFAKISEVVIEIETVSTKVIEKGNSNIAQTNIILEKLPKYILELERPIPMRRAFAMPRKIIAPLDNKQ